MASTTEGKGTPKRRTAASGGVQAERLRSKPGNAGYAGYEYQITVSVWVGLDLMLVKRVAEGITIEPRSDEDLEAAVSDPESGLLETAISGDGFDLVLQAKTRSGAPWTTPAVADVLLGKGNDAASKGGKRSRPLAMLETDERRRYVFVTNEASAEALRPHEGEHLFDFPEPTDLPPHARVGRDAGLRAQLAKRVLLLTNVTNEVLLGRIATQLEQHGHLPKARHRDCIRDLRDLVRDRICGGKDGIWNRGELIAVLVKNGGSVAPRRDMDHYVPPASYEAIRRRLDMQHVVVIAGPSGTGKTLTADILELELRRGMPPFGVAGEEHGPGPVRSSLAEPGSLLFHLRDPWGGNRLTPEADRWSSELPKLLELAGPGKKFLITSRSDVLESAGLSLLRELAPYIEYIRLEDYGAPQLGEIYDRIASDLNGHARILSVTYREDALAQLERPYEIRRFLRSLRQETVETPSKIHDLIGRSQIDAISSVIAGQLASMGVDGVQSAAIIWSMLVARGAVPDKVLAQLSRRLRLSDPVLRPDVQGLVDFLIAGDNLKRDGAALSFAHPRVEDGLRMAIMRRPDDAGDTLCAIVDQLICWDDEDGDWGRESALSIIRRCAEFDRLEVAPSARARTGLDGYLLALVREARGHYDVASAFRDLARFGSSHHLPSKLARHLIGRERRRKRPSFGPHWHAPDMTENERSCLQADPETRSLIERFVGEILPHSHDDYDSSLVAFLEALAPDLRDIFWKALEAGAHAGEASMNMDVILEGALLGNSPDYERAIESFALSEEEADAWMELADADLRKAEDHEIDADAVEHVLGQPEDQYHNARSGMEALVRIRRSREGTGFIPGHPRAPLLVRALASILQHHDGTVDLSELQMMLDVSGGWTRYDVWRAIEVHWDSSLMGKLEDEFASSDDEMDDVRKTLIRIMSRSATGEELVAKLSVAARSCTPQRRLELLRNVSMQGVKGDPKAKSGRAACVARATALAETYPDDERELAKVFARIVGGDDIKATSAGLSEAACNGLEQRLTLAPPSVAGPLVLIGVCLGCKVRPAAEVLLATGEADDGLVVLRAISMQEAEDWNDLLWKAVDHPRFRVRMQALAMLVPNVPLHDDRQALVQKAAGDLSADVRLAFARAMANERWPEAIEALGSLLSDSRDFSNQLSSNAKGSSYLVARAAADALAAYEELPASSVDVLIETSEARSSDPLVPCRALAALARTDDIRIDETLMHALSGPALHGSGVHRPLAQAAAWAIFDRARNGKLATLGAAAELALTEPGLVAGPLLVAAGLVEEAERRSIIGRLERDGASDRRDLVILAAAGADRMGGLQTGDRERLIIELSKLDSPSQLKPADLMKLEEWSRSLDIQGEFSRYAAWIAADLLGLPLSAELGNVRSPDLPSAIRVLTMGSLSPYRESGFDD